MNDGTDQEAVEWGRHVLVQESEAVNRCAMFLDEKFASAVDLILRCPGRVITCGIGKSGHIAKKTAGTLSSTGTPSQFLHAAEAVHGDLGMVTASDVVVLYSHSGETDELIRLFLPLRTIGARTILLTGRADSSAGRLADLVLDTGVGEEACPNNLAPTTSTTVMLALSDALAIAVMRRRGFSREDFARFHPSGTLGKRLLLTVADVMRPTEEIATVEVDTPVIDVIRAMTESHVGAACVVDRHAFIGLITESDLRRHLLNSAQLASTEWYVATAQDLMNQQAATILPELLAVEAFEVFQNYPIKIGEIPVVKGNSLLGLLVLKDLLRSGIV